MARHVKALAKQTFETDLTMLGRSATILPTSKQLSDLSSYASTPFIHGSTSGCSDLLPAWSCVWDAATAAPLLLSGETPTARYLTSTSSTVKLSVAFGGMVGFTPDVPYACMAHASSH